MLMVAVPVVAPRETEVAAPPMLRVVAPVLKSVAVAAVVVISPPLTARSPEVVISPVAVMVPAVVILPFEPLIEKLVAMTSFAPRERAVTIAGSERSRALVIAPPAEVTLIPAVRASLVSWLETSTSCAGEEVLVPSASAKTEEPVAPAAVVTEKLLSVVVLARVNAISRASVVVMVLPPS